MKLRHNKHPPQHPIADAGMIQYTWQSESSEGQGRQKVLESRSGQPSCLFESL